MEHEVIALDDISRVADHELVVSLRRLVRTDQTLSARMLVHIGELDARGLYREYAYASMFAYCVEELRMQTRDRVARGGTRAQARRREPHAQVARAWPRARAGRADGCPCESSADANVNPRSSSAGVQRRGDSCAFRCERTHRSAFSSCGPNAVRAGSAASAGFVGTAESGQV